MTVQCARCKEVIPEGRLKALPVWFSLLAYGKQGYQDCIENSVEMALQFDAFIQGDEKFELLAPTRLNNVCFTLSGDDLQEKVNLFFLFLLLICDDSSSVSDMINS